MGDNPFSDIVRQLLNSRLASIGALGCVSALLAAAFVRLIPWWLFFVFLLLALVGLVAFVLLRQWWAGRKDANLMGGLDSATQRDLGQRKVREREAVKDLQSKWKSSVEALKRSKIGRRRRFLYHLPWYVIIGAPACGKSTAIKNSGLHFPMGEPKLAGTGGTKNCDWWFAEEAIILDTAGRYTFGDEQAPDQEEWLAFLKLLRKYRPEAPINGLIVAVSGDALMTRDRDELVEDARNIREKIDQLVRELGIQFPIYLLITKCDLVEGFTEFFGRLPKKRLDEIVGWTNPSWEMQDPPRLVRTALAELRERLLAMRVNFLWEEERAERQRNIYLFPEEMRVFQQSLEEMCDVLFRENQYNESPFLRGIYLTSGLQSGTAVSRMLERLGLRAQATELREEKRSYFLKEFFQSHLPSDRNLVSISGRARGRLQVLNNTALAAIAAVAVLIAVVTGGSYVANRTLLNHLEDEMRVAAGPGDRPSTERLSALGRYVDALEWLDDLNRRRPLSAGWGLFTGYRAITPARTLFLTRFEHDAYGPSMDGARKALKTRDTQRSFLGLEAMIRNYVLSKLLNGTMAQAPGPNDALASFWPGTSPMSEELARSYGRGYIAYLRWRGGDTARAEQTSDLALLREALPDLFTVDRVAAWADGLYPAFRAQEVVPATVANGAVVRGAFTPKAWTERVAPLADAVDLVAGDVDPDLTRRFRAEYLARYFRDWDALLLRIREGSEGAIPLDTLLGKQSPYMAIVSRTADAAAIAIDEAQRPLWTKTVTRVAGEKDNYVGQLGTLARQVQGAEEDPVSALGDAKDIFARRVRVATVADDGAAPQDPFGKAEKWVDTTVNSGPAADPEDDRVRSRLTALLRAPVYEAFGAYLHAVAKEIDLEWKHRIVDRFTSTGGPADIEALYARPSGQVWAFSAEFLDPFFDQPAYAAKTRYTKRMPLTPNLPPFLNNADRTMKGIIGPGGGYRTHSILFETVPSEDTGEGGMRVTRTVLSVYCQDPEPWRLEHRQFRISKQLAWSPGVCGRTELRAYVGSDAGEEQPLEPLVADGPLGLLAMLKRAERQGNAFVWTLPGKIKVTFIVTLPEQLLELSDGVKPPTSLLQ